jgi:hypothetical protein|tara:strand:- start:1371 stop:1547 length:177 start_codon:yes stop_codon:yes gene_type:complete
MLFWLFGFLLAFSLPTVSSESTAEDDGPIHVPTVQGILGLNQLIGTKQIDSSPEDDDE